MRWIKLTLLSLLSASSLYAQAPTKEAINEELTAVFQAIYKNDPATLLKHSSPELIKHMGGKEDFTEMVNIMAKQFRDSDMTLEKVELARPAGYVTSDTQEAFYVKTVLTIKKGEQAIASETLQLGVRPKDHDIWIYMDITDKNLKAAKTFYPNLPANFKLPQEEGKPTKKHNTPIKENTIK